MMAEAHHIRLSRTPLTVLERDRLIALLVPLSAYLGAPGDWGADTRLGMFAAAAQEIAGAVRNAPTTGDAIHAQ